VVNNGELPAFRADDGHVGLDVTDFNHDRCAAEIVPYRRRMNQRRSQLAWKLHPVSAGGTSCNVRL
jgi:hypothetical protein